MEWLTWRNRRVKQHRQSDKVEHPERRGRQSNKEGLVKRTVTPEQVNSDRNP